MTKLIILHRNFANAPKREIFSDCFEEVLVFRVLNFDTCLVLFLLIYSLKLIRLRKFVAC